VVGRAPYAGLVRSVLQRRWLLADYDSGAYSGAELVEISGLSPIRHVRLPHPRSRRADLARRLGWLAITPLSAESWYRCSPDPE